MIAETPTQPRHFDGFRPGRVWSLWEMLKFNAADFYRVTTAIQGTITALGSRKAKSIEDDPDGGITITPIDDRVFLRVMQSRCDELDKSLKVLGAPITQMAVAELRLGLTSDFVTYEEIISGFSDVQRTLNRELTQVTLLALAPAERMWFEPQERLFGDDFDTKFRTQGTFELDEAAKCLALGRPTAAAFHFMRIMEIAVRAVAQSLQIPDPTKPAERNWGFILGEIEKGITKRWRTTADRMHGDGQLFDELHASLDAVKNPWRNSTMHVEKKYTDDEAQHIFAAVKGFMKKLAARMDENGEPKA